MTLYHLKSDTSIILVIKMVYMIMGHLTGCGLHGHNHVSFLCHRSISSYFWSVYFKDGKSEFYNVKRGASESAGF